LSHELITEIYLIFLSLISIARFLIVCRLWVLVSLAEEMNVKNRY